MCDKYINQLYMMISAIEAYTRDLTTMALQAAPLRTHENAVSRIMEIHSRPARHECHPMLIGESDKIWMAIVTDAIR